MNNMYEKVKTWNPISGKCPHSCSYCAVQKITLPEPTKDEVLQLIKELSKFTTVIQKSNLKRII